MTSKLKFYAAGILAGVIACAFLAGMAYSAYREKTRVLSILKTVYKEYVYRSRQNKQASLAPIAQKKYNPNEEIVISVDASRALGQVSRMLYGANLAPRMESEEGIIKFAQDTGITCFRFPGGVYGYHWSKEMFDVETRYNSTPLRKIDYLIEFCKRIGAQLVWQVNVETGTAQEAAALVEYLNKKSGYPVQYWELGNEVYGDWDPGYMSGEKYAKVVAEYSTAMKKVDPNIKIGIDWAPPTRNFFNTAVLKKAGDHIDFISLHWYPTPTSPNKPKDGRIHPLPLEVMAGYLQLPAIIAEARDIITRCAPQKKGKIEFTVLEYDGAMDGPSSNFPPFSQGIAQWSFSNAMFYVDALGTMALNNVTVAAAYDLQSVGFGFIKGWDKEAGWGGQRWDQETVRPKAFAIQMFAKYFGDTLITNSIENAPFYSIPYEQSSSARKEAVPYISCYASTFSKTKTVALLLTNKHPTDAYKVRVKLKGLKPQSTGNLVLLTAPDFMAQNEGKPMAVRLKEFKIENIKQDFVYTIPARSINVLQIYEEQQ